MTNDQCVLSFFLLFYFFFKPIVCADNKYVQGKAWSFLILKMHFLLYKKNYL